MNFAKFRRPYSRHYIEQESVNIYFNFSSPIWRRGRDILSWVYETKFGPEIKIDMQYITRLEFIYLDSSRKLSFYYRPDDWCVLEDNSI